MSKLLDFLGYVAVISHRFVREYTPQLKPLVQDKKEDKLLRLRKNEVLKEMKQILELYQAYQVEYDYFDHKNLTAFSYFIVRTKFNIQFYSRKNLKQRRKR